MRLSRILGIRNSQFAIPIRSRDILVSHMASRLHVSYYRTESIVTLDICSRHRHDRVLLVP